MTHRKSSPKSIRLSCMLEVAGYSPVAGHTRELSEDEAVLQCPNLTFPGIKKPVTGGTGVLTIAIRGIGTPREILRIPCRITYISGNVVGLHLNTIPLDIHQKEVFEKLLDLES